jgi:hypothetical protein
VTWQVLQIAAIALVAVSFLKTAQHFKDPLPASLASQTVQLPYQTSKFVSFAKAMNDAQEAFYFIVKEHDVALADSAVKALESAPPLDPKADELRERLKNLLLKAKALNASAEPSTKPAPRNSQQQQAELTAEFISWSKEYNTWLKTTGRTYGLVEVPETQSSPK